MRSPTTSLENERPKNENKMSTQKAKFQLFARLAELGFTYEESAQLRRIEMMLQRWAECGNDSGHIERDEADALRRCAAIVKARNDRKPFGAENVTFYHPSDPRGCALYILRESDIACTKPRPREPARNRATQTWGDEPTTYV